MALALSALAERRNIQPSLLVVMVGLAASYVPGVPPLELEPEFILSIVLPPVLFTAARDFSFADFRRRLGSIVNLGVFLIFASTIVVSVAVLMVLPDLLPVTALILAVVIAPPDAVAAIAIGRRAGLPAGLMTVLKGESLINDAAALTLFSVLVAVATGTHAFIDNVPLYFLYAASVGIIVGLVIGNVAHWVRGRLSNARLATALSVVVPFAAYLIGEELHASGVLAVVAAGFAVGHHGVQSHYRERMQEGAFWRTVETLLETFVFAYIGLQLRFVITDANEAGFDTIELTTATLVIFVALVAVRFAWIFGSAALGRWRYRRIMAKLRDVPAASRRGRRPVPQVPLSWRENTVLSWTGMRGVVTLAAAAGTPLLTASGEALPGREAIVSLAFLVTIATLLIQGLTLPFLIDWLKLDNKRHEHFVAQEVERAEKIAHDATGQALDAYARAHPDPRSQQLVENMRRRFDASRQAQQPSGIDPQEALAIGRTLLEARRARLIQARDGQELDDTVVRDMLDKLDLEQAYMDSVGRARGGRTSPAGGEARAG